MTTTLVTGGCGFVGRHLIQRLSGEGHDLWVIDDLSTGLHPDLWLGGNRTVTNDDFIRYEVNGRAVTFVHDDLSVVMLKQLGIIRSSEVLKLPFFNYVYALASV